MNDFLLEFFEQKTSVLGAAIISAVVAAMVTYLFKMVELRQTLLTQYKHEQQKELRALIGRYHGRLLLAANTLNYRMWNLYRNWQHGWLNVQGGYSRGNYYFNSFAYRFMNVAALIREFEAEAIFLDGRIATPNDKLFVSYSDAFHWCFTDVSLFENLPYDAHHQTDHFFADLFRNYCDRCLDNEGVISFDEFTTLITSRKELAPVCEFFDGLTQGEGARYRWDRLVVLHLLLMAFVNTFGYPTQETSAEKFKTVAARLEHEATANNLLAWLPRLGLDKDKHGKRIASAVRAALPGLRHRTVQSDPVVAGGV